MSKPFKTPIIKNHWEKNLFSIAKVCKIAMQSPMYSASNHHTNASRKEKLIKSYRNTEFTISEVGFSQFDLAVALAYKKIITHQQKFKNIEVSLANIIKLLSRADGGKTRALVLESLKRHSQSTIGFDFGGNDFFEGYRFREIAEYQQNIIHISSDEDYLATAYVDNETCDINIDTFLSLNPGLQSWLYGFFCSEPEVNSIDLDLLHNLSGANYSSLSDFKKSVKEALGSLHKKNIIGWQHGVTRDNIVFWRNATLL